MIGPVLLALLGATTFIDQDFATLRVTGIDPITGQAMLNFRSADLDGDGQNDLVLPDVVLFQRRGLFPPETAASLPRIEEGPSCDIHERTLYLRLPGRFEAYRWVDERWRMVLGQEIEWPGGGLEAEEPPPRSTDAQYRFTRFLHDLDLDGNPEVVLPGPGGLHVFRITPTGLEAQGVLAVFPQPQPAYSPETRLWPPEARRVTFPPRQMACQTFLDGNTVTVLVRLELDSRLIRYQSTRYAVNSDNGFTLEATPLEVRETSPLPSYVQPCRLNEDDSIDFAGGDWRFSDTSLLPTPIYEIAASLDGGRTLHTVRTVSFRPRSSFIDFDGDGALDMITESTGLLGGGTRETVSRFLTEKRLSHEIRIHFQSTTGEFPRTPDIRKRFSILLEKLPYRNGPLFRRYQYGELVDLSGDFNADGYRDLVVQDRSDRLALYFNHHNRLPRNPDQILSIPKNGRFTVADIDGDGRSDIAIQLEGPEDLSEGPSWRVLFSRETDE